MDDFVQGTRMQATDFDTRSWMVDLFDGRGEIALGDLIIPGSHDSDTSVVVTEKGPDQGCSQLVVEGEIASPVGKCAIAKLTKTQDRSIDKQLADGIRYFDLRVGVAPNKGAYKGASDRERLVTQHTLVLEPLVDTMGKILAFSSQHPKEQVIIHFQKLQFPTNRDRWLKVFNDVLHEKRDGGPSVCERAWTEEAISVEDAALKTVTLDQAWGAGLSYPVLVADDQVVRLKEIAAAHEAGCYRNANMALATPWPQADNDVPKIIQIGQKYLTDRQALLKDGGPGCDIEEENWCGFFVSQLQSKPPDLQYAACVAKTEPGCSILEQATKTNPTTIDAFITWVGQGLPANIAIVDYYNHPSGVDYAKRLITLNTRSRTSR
ncbi:MAG: hypothetical protein JKY27_00390 [Magnetovibrio sp.]|nr:hypothetical protein [Magnetovibrio sp.]